MDTSTYKKRGTDVVGFWNPDLGPIHCKPFGAKLFDGNIDPTKPSTLLICELVEPCNAIVSKDDDGDDQPVKTAAGDLVGVWGKPGMAPIKTMYGEPIVIQYERDEKGEIKTKKMKKKGMNPMKMFDVLSAHNPMKTIPVIEDTRVDSAHVRTMLAGPKVQQKIDAPKQPDATSNDTDDDDVPF